MGGLGRLWMSAGCAAALAGCVDLALEPDRMPDSMTISPEETRVRVGDAGKLTATVFDQDGQVMPGPPAWAPPLWHASDPGAVSFGSDGAFTTLGHGEVSVRAHAAGLVAHGELLISPHSVVLSAPVAYLTQAVQNLDGGVPLIAGRDAFLRVFATGDQVSYYEPRALADFLVDGRVVHTVEMGPPYLIPDAVNERWLSWSFNARVPGDLIREGVQLAVELDPEGVVPLGSGSVLRVPEHGALALNVTTLPPHRQTIVPVVTPSDSDQDIVDWARGLTDESLRFAWNVLPIGDREVAVHEPYRSNADLSRFEGWTQLIREILVMRQMEGRDDYYYGAAVLPRNSAIGGLGYVGYPVSVGANSAGVFAHELGHNLSLMHAPCGGAGNPDRRFPYDDGGTGVWGYDPELGALIDPTRYKDLMGYCGPDWISDYSFVKALNYRVETETRDGVRVATEIAPVATETGGAQLAGSGDEETTLLLWGSAGNGELLLEPAFRVETRPRLPAQGGPYRLEGFGAGGEPRFGFDFAPTPLALGGGHFVFAVPFDPRRDGDLAHVVLSGPEGEVAVQAGSARPTAIVADRGSGQVHAILRDWDGGPTLLDGNAAIMISDGLPPSAR